MSVESAADRAALLADHGVAVTVGANTITGILDKGWVERQGLSGYLPVLMVTDEDVTAQNVAEGTALTIGAVAYTVKIVEPDGTGFTQLVLEEV